MRFSGTVFPQHGLELVQPKAAVNPHGLKHVPLDVESIEFLQTEGQARNFMIQNCGSNAKRRLFQQCPGKRRNRLPFEAKIVSGFELRLAYPHTLNLINNQCKRIVSDQIPGITSQLSPDVLDEPLWPEEPQLLLPIEREPQ